MAVAFAALPAAFPFSLKPTIILPEIQPVTVFSTLLAAQKSFSATSPLAAFLDRLIARPEFPDPAPSSATAVINAVHTIAQDATDHTGGTFALTVTLRNGETFTTAGIVFNANAATIEGAIDTAATAASITGWTNGDISVSGGILQAAGAAVVLTFDGTSVAGQNHDLTVFDGALLTGGAEPTTRVTQTTPGQTARPAWDFLLAAGIVSGTIPQQSAAADATAVTVGGNLTNIPANIVVALAAEAAAEDANNGTYYSLIEALGYADRAPRLEQLGASTGH